MKILSREPKAKLWLLNFSKAASKYLRKEECALKSPHVVDLFCPYSRSLLPS